MSKYQKYRILRKKSNCKTSLRFFILVQIYKAQEIKSDLAVCKQKIVQIYIKISVTISFYRISSLIFQQE